MYRYIVSSIFVLSMYRKSVKISVKLLIKANEQGFFRSLAYFIEMKSIYKNCTLYQFSYKALCAKLNCSSSTAHKHVKILTQLGLIRIHNGNLTFNGHDAIKAMKGIGKSRLLSIPTTGDILLNMKFALLNENLETQHHSVELRLKEKFNSQKGRRRRKSNKPETSKQFCDYVGLSLQGIADLFKSVITNGRIHPSTALRWKKKLVAAKLIICNHQYKIIESGFTLQMFLAYRDLVNDYSLLFFGKAGLVTKRAHDQILSLSTGLPASLLNSLTP